MEVAATLPPKYKNLIDLAQKVPVPPLTCLTEAELGELFDNFDAAQRRIGEILQKIDLTSGTFLSKHIRELDRVAAGLSFRLDVDERLDEIMEDTFGRDYARDRYAVRSASLFEDTGSQSYAGLYETVLNVCGNEALKAAIRTVWRSALSRPALSERMNSEVSFRKPAMNIIVQRMVDGVISGVGFSRDPVTGNPEYVVEYVEGLGDGLVSGEMRSRRIRFDTNGEFSLRVPAETRVPKKTSIPAEIKAVASLIHQVRTETDWDVDMEWSWDGETVWLLQVRPVTTAGQALGEFSREPVWETAALYGDDEAAVAAMGRLPDYAAYFRKKRKAIYDFAQRHSFAQGAALLIRLNRRGLNDNVRRRALEKIFTGNHAVLDFSEKVRQVILQPVEIARELKSLMPHPDRIHTIVIRDFIAGNMGLITRVNDTQGRVICEYSADGLLAINRGTARSTLTVLDGRAFPSDLSPEVCEKLMKTTVAAQEEIGNIQIEWVAEGSRLFPVDFSPLPEAFDAVPPVSCAVISQGYARGEAIHVDQEGDLVAMSIAPAMSLTEVPSADQMGGLFDILMERLEKCETKPILLSPRPYAALAPLIPHVAGFVFEHASMLCHLSILIREKGIPAVSVENRFNEIKEGCSLIVDTDSETPVGLLQTVT